MQTTRSKAACTSRFSPSLGVEFHEVGGSLLTERWAKVAGRVRVEDEAIDGLTELGLTLEIVERVVRRADAEASTCTALDPPIMAGLTRWSRTTRYLREELIPAGWRYDNPRNLARTIHPSGEFAIVATSGDELTGMVGLLPTTKYSKGYATIKAVEDNGQLAFDFGDFDLGPYSDRAVAPGSLLTWFMLFRVDDDGFRVELSLPDGIVDGRITSWAERIILPVLPRDEDRLNDVMAPFDGDDQDEDIVVEVNRRYGQLRRDSQPC